MPLTYSWAFAAPRDAPVRPMQGSDAPPPPPSGTESLPDESGAPTSYGALANQLDAARTRLNEIVTCWKDAVGPEEDSAQGRSNQASKATVDADDEEVEDEDSDEDQSE
ncbi:hypothetical protein MBRA1_002368 [Malassezia brasiliensis]|uniref:Uncharacterized protein n=1 Tax=Malassezia brasiliensis TaxID=1821822 RepID=A0AAF0IP13_9BASI|nr:hypothetical protein MBRA1_002368 [Malassezia brasiliensis]